ncbi:hypothetical protein O6H91_19G005000 [Diphasiastrum complanatum]|uniref:Uncharacterized protein n=1 Tax=Diphasiastrum complanatum TaxID=34168 RepID=A0ACC2ASA0_DIPCM|nr:hypothetical protein O6H91_Y123000 [Diphasiastrum complanatum]KAJ7520414.1 hypothetical protein O6H91_19G005000 [Diphasiastrum complanatum]
MEVPSPRSVDSGTVVPKVTSSGSLPARDADGATDISACKPSNTAFETTKETAHLIGNDSWLQVGMILVTSLNSAFVLSYPKIVMAYLGWTAGILGLVVGAAMSLHANILIASIHFTGGKRHIRYRDLAEHLYGRKMYILTWISQYTNLFTINAGFIILAGEALKGIYVTYNDSSDLKLPHWVAITGGVCFIFAFFVPHLSALRVWLAISGILTSIYIVIVLVLSVRDGRRIGRRDYAVQGTSTQKFFNVISGVANIAFSYSSGILPELQATLRAPAVLNMKKALYLLFTVGCAVMYTVLSIGYWAYGSEVSSYLLASVSGSKSVITVANVAVFLQTIVSLHVFASPMYEYWDTKFADQKQGEWSPYNMAVRVVARGLYLTFNTFIAALLPFIGDFTSLTGALSVFPLTFVLAHHMYLRAKWGELSLARRGWHYLNVVFFSLLSVLSAIAAIRLIVVDSSTYHVFADV